MNNSTQKSIETILTEDKFTSLFGEFRLSTLVICSERKWITVLNTVYSPVMNCISESLIKYNLPLIP